MVFVLSAAVLTCRALFSHSHQQRELAKSVCLHREKWYMTQAANSRCRADASQMTQRLALLKDISSALNKSNTLHWLCYGTLWGVLRGNSLLDYDIDGDLCVVNVSQNALARIVAAVGEGIRYAPTYTSLRVWRAEAIVEITLYEFTELADDNTVDTLVNLSGWTGPYVSRSCKIESFPSRLITRPLPSDKLNEVLFPVPREGVEMQMHVYPDDWHSIVLPQHCV